MPSLPKFLHYNTQGHYHTFLLGEGKYLEKGNIIIRLARTIFKISFFFHLGTLLREGCLLVGYFNGEIRVSSFFTKAELRTAIR